MFGLFRIAPERFQITVPPLERIALPHGAPVNVGLLRGPLTTLVDTGFAGGRAALLAALDELGVAPASVSKILLTSLLPEAVGNVEAFPNATVHAVSDSATIDVRGEHAALRAEIEALVRGLADGTDGNPEWDVDEAELMLDVYFHGPPDALDVVPVADDERVSLGGGTARVLATPGVDSHGACWVDEQESTLFGGETLSLEPRPRIRRPQQYTDSLGRVSQLTPSFIVTAHGPVERSYFAAFRTLNLGVANLVQNMPFALQGPTPLAVIAYRDIGYWPRDLVRFAAHVAQFGVMLDELVASGVAGREGTGPWASYSMERPSRV